MTETDTPVFSGWPAEATAFLAELAADNTRTFWTENAHRYRAALLEPTRALAVALTPEFGPAAGVPPVRGPAIPAERRPVPHGRRHHGGRAGRHAVRGGAVGPGAGGAGRPPGVRRRAATPLPGGRGRAAGGGARRGAGGAGPRRSRAGRRPCAGAAASRLPGGPPTAAVAPMARPACRPRVVGGRVAGHGGAAASGSRRLGGPHDRWPTGSRRTSGRASRSAHRALRPTCPRTTDAVSPNVPEISAGWSKAVSHRWSNRPVVALTAPVAGAPPIMGGRTANSHPASTACAP